MYRAIPCIPAHVNELKQCPQHEHDRHKKPRLQMLYLLASGQAYSRQDVAQLLGVHRRTIGRWLAIYGAGGLQAFGHPCPSWQTRLPGARGPRQS